jgi:hypothetical protein
VEGGFNVREERDRVCDEAGFCGNVRGVVECRKPEATVVAGEEMCVWDSGD